MASVTITKSLECPVCLDIFTKPIIQCQKGHSFCFKCLLPNKPCPMCRGIISGTRNFVLESVLDSTLLPCENTEFGCHYRLDKDKMILHRSECQYRKIKCQGKLFCNWSCNFEDRNIHDHFKKQHKDNANLQFNSTVAIVYNCTTNFNDIQLISAHYHLFWYKHKVDTTKQQAYWAFQFIGPKIQAQKFYYEFEFFDESVRKFKITEVCQNDVEDINKIFEEERCVVISLKYLKTFVNRNNEYSFRFRIMKKQEKLDGKGLKKPILPKK